jgi:hypothetical protein
MFYGFFGVKFRKISFLAINFPSFEEDEVENMELGLSRLSLFAQYAKLRTNSLAPFAPFW